MKYNLNRKLLQKIGIIFSGSLLSQAILFLATIVLARLYTPEQFGDFAIFLGWANVLALLFTGRYELAIILPQSDLDARHLFLASAGLAHLFLILGAAVGLIWNNLAGLNLLPVTLAAYLLALLSVFQYSLIRESRFSAYSFSRITFATGIAAFQLGLFYVNPENGLTNGYLFGAGLTILCLALFLKNRFPSLPSFYVLRKVMSKYFSITKWSLPGSLFNALTNNIQPFLIGFVFSSREAGLFFLAYRLVGTPLTLITNSVSQVFFKEAAACIQDGSPEKLRKLTRNISLTMAGLLGISFSLFFLLGDTIFIRLFGKKWTGGSLIVFWLIPYFVGKGIFNPISSLAEALNKTKLEMLFSIFVFLMLVSAIFLGYYCQSIKVFLLVFSCVTGLGYLALWLLYYQILKQGKYEARL
ncbi:MAG: oligosaccharide flippase family protein [Lewinellaceae bacterium]|nr:oligosaccharide flippase family protein [Lewinellaceae bacterium]